MYDYGGQAITEFLLGGKKSPLADICRDFPPCVSVSLHRFAGRKRHVSFDNYIP
jgi:hypothetical protein